MASIPIIAQLDCLKQLARSALRATLDTSHPRILHEYTNTRISATAHSSIRVPHSGTACRTATERINSQAKALGIERPRIRNGQAITNLNTLIYVLINLRALQRIRIKKASSSNF